VSAVSANSQTNVGLSGTVAYRFNRALAFGVEITSVPQLPPRLGNPSIGRPIIQFQDTEGKLTVFTTNVRLEVPTVWRRVIPFVVGGGGVSNYDVSYSILYPVPLIAATGNVPGLSIFPTPIIEPLSDTRVQMALTLGGGVSLLWTDHISIDFGAKTLQLLGNGGSTIGRFGVGASYRF
jgi:hypothetical protein